MKHIPPACPISAGYAQDYNGNNTFAKTVHTSQYWVQGHHSVCQRYREFQRRSRQFPLIWIHSIVNESRNATTAGSSDAVLVLDDLSPISSSLLATFATIASLANKGAR